jgi:hypothetical protein
MCGISCVLPLQYAGAPKKQSTAIPGALSPPWYVCNPLSTTQDKMEEHQSLMRKLPRPSLNGTNGNGNMRCKGATTHLHAAMWKDETTRNRSTAAQWAGQLGGRGCEQCRTTEVSDACSRSTNVWSGHLHVNHRGIRRNQVRGEGDVNNALVHGEG